MPVVVFRVDASETIGSGHLMRCLTLANAFQSRDAMIHLISRDLPETYQSIVKKQGITLHLLPLSQRKNHADDTTPHAAWLGVDWKTDATQCEAILQSLPPIDLLVIDHYGLDARWESHLRPLAKKHLVIDDLADRPHDCDILLDQNFYYNSEARYQSHVGKSTVCLLGSRYALLRPEFRAARESSPRQHRASHPISRINICFGGIDARCDTLKTLEALKDRISQLSIDVIIGSGSPHIEKIKQYVTPYPTITLHISPCNVAELLALADLGMGASGTMVWERAAVGLPSITMAVANNQRQVGYDSGKTGAHIYLGDSDEVTTRQLRSAIDFIFENPIPRELLAENSLALTDGLGAERVAQLAIAPKITLRQATADDSKSIYSWRNHPITRRHSHISDEISYEEHRTWYENTLQSDKRFLLIGSDIMGPVGVLRFDHRDSYWLASIYLVPERHGERLGSVLLTEGLAWLRQRSKGPVRVQAEIHPDNPASTAAFKRAGFNKVYSTFITEVAE